MAFHHVNSLHSQCNIVRAVEAIVHPLEEKTGQFTIEFVPVFLWITLVLVIY